MISKQLLLIFLYLPLSNFFRRAFINLVTSVLSLILARIAAKGNDYGALAFVDC